MARLLYPSGFSLIAQGGSPENRNAQADLPRRGIRIFNFAKVKTVDYAYPSGALVGDGTCSQGFRPELITGAPPEPRKTTDAPSELWPKQ